MATRTLPIGRCVITLPIDRPTEATLRRFLFFFDDWLSIALDRLEPAAATADDARLLDNDSVPSVGEEFDLTDEVVEHSVFLPTTLHVAADTPGVVVSNAAAPMAIAMIA